MRYFTYTICGISLISLSSFGFADAQNLKEHYASRRAAWEATQVQTAVIVKDHVNRNAPKVAAVGPTQDKYGDPMYTWYGPLPVSPGTPNYQGPRYGESFSRAYVQPVSDKTYRGYARGAFSNPGLTAVTDQNLGVKANPAYYQHGMQTRPGYVYPSAARTMINNP